MTSTDINEAASRLDMKNQGYFHHRVPERIALRRAGKRAVDTVFASIALVALSPLLLSIVVGLKLSLRKAPVLVRQLRVGLHGRKFYSFKFRTLPPSDISDPSRRNAEPGQPNRFERLLRRTFLDELPQLWNIVRGDLSFVGPYADRPLLHEQFVEFDNLNTALKLEMRPGMISARSTLRSNPTVNLLFWDVDYVVEWNLWRDVKALGRVVLHQSAVSAKELRRIVDENMPNAYVAKGVGKTVDRRGPDVSTVEGSKRDPEQTRAIREWANANGYEVSDRGRIPATVVEAFDADH